MLIAGPAPPAGHQRGRVRRRRVMGPVLLSPLRHGRRRSGRELLMQSDADALRPLCSPIPPPTYPLPETYRPTGWQRPRQSTSCWPYGPPSTCAKFGSRSAWLMGPGHGLLTGQTQGRPPRTTEPASPQSESLLLPARDRPNIESGCLAQWPGPAHPQALNQTRADNLRVYKPGTTRATRPAPCLGRGP